MIHGLVLPRDRLLAVADGLAEAIRIGLAREPPEAAGVVRCLPSYHTVPERPSTGEAVVLDTGGTWIRAAVVDAARGVIDAAPPWRIPRPGPVGVDDFLDRHAALVRDLDPEGRRPIGWIWSFPARALADGDAEHLAWTKAFPVTGRIGAVGAALRRRLPGRHVAVLNDTVAALLAGPPARPDVVGWLGLVVGTGHNIAIAPQERDVARIGGLRAVRHAVNLESGGFDPGPLTAADAALDSEDRPGWQRMEKAVAGYTMADLYRRLGGAGRAEHAGDVVDLLHAGDALAEALVQRSAALVAAAISGAARFVGRPAAVSGEGSLYGNPSWRQRFCAVLADLDPTVEALQPVADANARGAAAAALGNAAGSGAA